MASMMRGTLQNPGQRNGYLITALLLMGCAMVYWFRYGWGLSLLPWGDAWEPLLPVFPAEALTSFVLTTLAVFSCIAVGLVVVPTSLYRRPAMALPVGFLVGAAAVAMLSSFLAFAIIVPGLLYSLGILSAFLLYKRREKLSFPTIKGLTPEVFLMVLACLFVMLVSLLPLVESDGLRYHVAAPQEWLREGRFVLLPYHANSNIPSMMGLLAAQVSGFLELGRNFQLFHAFHLLALVFVMGDLARLAYRSIRGHGQEHIVFGLAGLFTVSLPVIAIVASWPFSDVASMAYFFAGIWALLSGSLRRRGYRLTLGSLFLGACLATKFSNLPLVGLVGLAALVREIKESPRPLHFVMLLLPGFLMLAPWFTKNIIHHGNPVYPIAYGVFGGSEWSPANDVFYKEKLAEKGLGRGIDNLLLSPLRMTDTQGAFESQNPGPMLLGLLPIALLLPFLLGPFRRGNRTVVVLWSLLIAGWLLWFLTYQAVRFFMPELLLMVLLGSVGIGWMLDGVRQLWVRSMVRVFLLGFALISLSWIVSYNILVLPNVQVVLGRFNPDVYTARRFNTLDAIQWLESNTEENEPVLYVGEHRIAYATHYKPIASDWFDTPMILTAIRESDRNEDMIAAWKEHGIRYVLFNLGELSLYERSKYFQGRFSADEWERYLSIREFLLGHLAFQNETGQFVVKLP